MRFDLKILASWIEPGSTVLGLGCGEGDLLYYLKQEKNVKETGIEIKEKKVAACIEKGLSVLQGDINKEILDYSDKSFDYCILSQTLQQVYDPEGLIKEILRVGKKAIVSFPNFGHIKIRLQLLAGGKAPVSKELPFQWYDSPNIRVLTLEDFKIFANKIGFNIHKKAAIKPGEKSHEGKIVNFLPNMFATYGIYEIGK
ncbi:MAG: methionine biosynthesis protein MetW [Desulfobacteraceae bacterium]|nr:methionine biosynthesis protein MetW [Desulfobacteraceae bacterium]